MRYAAMLVLVAAGMAFGAPDELKYQDKVYPIDKQKGGPQRDPKVVEISEETFDRVKFNLGAGASSDLPREEIYLIRYDPKEGGSELDAAKKALDGGQDASAMYKTLLNKVQSGGGRKLFEQHALWGYAVSLHNLGKLTEAAALYAQLIDKYPKTLYLYAAAEKAVYCFLGAGDVAGAKATLGKLQGVKPDDGGKFDATRDYLAGLIEETAKNPSGAMASYKKVEVTKFADVAGKGKLGVGRCMVATGDFAGAERKFREVIDSGAAKGMTLGGAWNGIGESNIKQGEEAKNPAQKVQFFHNALMAYLRCAIQYNPLPDESDEEKVKAMAKAGYCFEQVADAQDTPENKLKYKDRARSMYQDAMGAGGGWGKWASDHLNKMR